MPTAKRGETQLRPWARIKSFKGWREAWYANLRGKKSFGLARDLLFSLPDLISTPRTYVDQVYCTQDPEERRKLKDLYGALCLAMDITLDEPDRHVAERAQRAANLLLKGVLSDKRGLPNVCEDLHSRRGWDQGEYRSLPKRLLRFYSHPRSYSVGAEVYEKNAHNWAWTLLRLEQERLEASGRGSRSYNTQAFDWPDCQVEPHRTQFLRTLILTPHVHRPSEFAEMLPVYFDLLVDARDSWLAEQDNYPRKPTGEWPVFDQQHSMRLNLELYELGLELGMPVDRIKPIPLR